jgi:outer membrane usher protein
MPSPLLLVAPALPMALRLLLTLPFMLLALSVFASERTWIILNNDYKGGISLDFYGGKPCLTRPLMEEWGVITPLLDRLRWDNRGCLTESSAQEYHLQYWYQPDADLLTLLFPALAINAQQNGVSTSRWDDGITALFVNYRLDVDNQRARYSWDTPGTDATLKLDNGLNVGPWRLRYSNVLWRERDGQHGSYSDSVALWRSITPLRSRLTFGDGNTSANLFDSFTFRGISLASDQAMFPDSWRPWTPWINGYARTEAEVTIHQNGQRVYRIHVPPGPFTIRDFYPPDTQGNLELTIQESDGTERTRLLPYSIMPNLVQHGMFSYELAAGRYKPYHGIELQTDRFWQTTLSWGAAPRLTLFGGLQQGEHYLSPVAGIGGNLGSWGALSADVSHARYTQARQSQRGSVWRLRYAKAFLSTQTSLNARLQWYPDGSQYRTFAEKISRAGMLAYGLDDDTTRRAMQGQLEINQNIGEDSSVSLSWNWTKGRDGAGSRQNLEVSLDYDWRDLDVSLYGGYQRYPGMRGESTLGVNISIPLSLGERTVNVGYVSELASLGNDSHGVNVYGSALDDYSLRYDLTAKHEVHGNDALEASLGWQYNAGEANASLTRSGSQRDLHADVSGSVLLFDGGIALGQVLGGTSALVEVPGVSGVGFYNQFGSTTNGDGRLLVSYMTPWRVNRVTVDTFSQPEERRFAVSEREAVPTDGAILYLRFPTPIQSR